MGSLAIKNSDEEIRDGVWRDSTKANGSSLLNNLNNQSIILDNQLTALSNSSNMLNNQSIILANLSNADNLIDTVDGIVDTIFTNTTTILNNISTNTNYILINNLPANASAGIAADSALGYVMGGSDMATYDRSTDSLQSIRDSADTGYANVINIIGEGGHTYTAQTATEPGDDVSVMGGLRYVSDTFKDTGGFGGRKVQKDITFSNLNTTATLFNVSGDVIVRVIGVCTTNLESSGGSNAEVGILADPDAILPTTDVTLLEVREIWHDATPDSEIEALSVMREYIITDGNNIIITPSAQIDSGAISFYCFWTPLGSTSDVSSA